MTELQYTTMCNRIKEQELTIEDLTNIINDRLDPDVPKVCEQEEINYLMQQDPLPDEIEKILIEEFKLNISLIGNYDELVDFIVTEMDAKGIKFCTLAEKIGVYRTTMRAYYRKDRTMPLRVAIDCLNELGYRLELISV